MRALLINPNTNAATTATMVAISRGADPHARVEGATVRTGAALLMDETLLAAGAAAVVELVRGTDFSDYDGAIVAAFGDPGLEESRAHCPVPVVGIAEAGMGEAAAGGRRFSVVTTTPLLVGAIERRAEAYGLGAQFAGVRLTQGDIAVVMADPKTLEAVLARACEIAIAEDQAQAIVIGGGPLAIAARALSGRFDVPVVEPIPAAMRLLRTRIDRGGAARTKAR
jgi:allantoin racemase